MTREEAREARADEFLDVATGKGLVWLLIGVGVLAVFIAGVQIGIATVL